MKKSLLLAILFCATVVVHAQEINIIPKPASLKQLKIAGSFNITPVTQIVLEGSNMDNSVNFLNGYLQRYYFFKLKVFVKVNLIRR